MTTNVLIFSYPLNSREMIDISGNKIQHQLSIIRKMLSKYKHDNFFAKNDQNEVFGKHEMNEKARKNIDDWIVHICSINLHTTSLD